LIAISQSNDNKFHPDRRSTKLIPCGTSQLSDDLIAKTVAFEKNKKDFAPTWKRESFTLKINTVSLKVFNSDLKSFLKKERLPIDNLS